MKSQTTTSKSTFTIWGNDIDQAAINQLENACSLDISIRGALMPDAHVGYGLPIGGVLATEDAVIPYAVGYDIACRVHMSVLDIPVSHIQSDKKSFIKAITNQTRFGVGAKFSNKKSHPVMDDELWSFSKFMAILKDKAWSQLGTSGSGNHFVDIGVLEIKKHDSISPGKYTAILSHSGSRGTGAAVATHYSQIAMKQHKKLAKHLKHLAWLQLASQEGQEYWKAMTLMGKYSSANHQLIHKALHQSLGVESIIDFENHHNFAWKETYERKDVIVHRKGATPAFKDTFAVIPGTMASPSFLIQGRGVKKSLNSAAHGAGRKLSRKAALKIFNWIETNKILEDNGISLISAGLDESPYAYKDIYEVMNAQKDLVKIAGVFTPLIVKMA